jgi:Xaa-Pro dipeptidase
VQPPIAPEPSRVPGRERERARGAESDGEARTLDRRALLGGAAGLALGACAAPPAATAPPPTEPVAPAEAPEPAREARERAAERFADLSDATRGAEPITEADRAARRARLGRLLAERGLDALICEGGATMSYLTGVGWGRSERLFALVVDANGRHFWLCPAFEESKARLATDGAGRPCGDYVTWQEDEYAFRPLCAELRARGVKKLAIEPAFRHGFVDRIAAAARADGSFAELAAQGVLVSGAELVVALRGCKDAKELALLRRANELTKQALVRVAEELRPGMDGAAVGSLVNAAHRKLGMTGPWNLSLVGPAAALPHGDASRQPLAEGDVLLIDCGAGFLGYQSDITRTWVPFGKAPAEVERAWNDVRDAQRAAFDALRPGRRCREIDAAARAAIEARGWPGGFGVFTHRLGHGIGMEGHEDPYFDGGSEVVLAEGMTLSNEPGIYLPGRFGVRIEDIVHVTRDGAGVFGDWQRGVGSPA